MDDDARERRRLTPLLRPAAQDLLDDGATARPPAAETTPLSNCSVRVVGEQRELDGRRPTVYREYPPKTTAGGRSDLPRGEMFDVRKKRGLHRSGPAWLVDLERAQTKNCRQRVASATTTCRLMAPGPNVLSDARPISCPSAYTMMSGPFTDTAKVCCWLSAAGTAIACGPVSKRWRPRCLTAPHRDRIPGNTFARRGGARRRACGSTRR